MIHSIEETQIKGLKLIHRDRKIDHRGYFENFFSNLNFESILPGEKIKQINMSFSEKKGTIRGMHFQRSPFLEYKLVSCISGSVFDVVIDLRQKSKTFFQTFSINLDNHSGISLLIPPGFAHGFQTLESNTKLIYIHTNDYSAEYEDGINPNDPIFNIQWPLECSSISLRDRSHNYLTRKYEGVIT